MTLTELELGQLIALKKEGHSGYIVQQKLRQNCNKKISINQINLIFRQWNQFNGKKPDTRGGKSLFNEQQIEAIKQRLRNWRTTTAVDIMKSKVLNPNSASIRCIQILLNKIGFKVRKAPSKPSLKSINVEKRIEYGENLIEWTQEEIEMIVFTDESKLFSKKRGRILLRVNKGYQIPIKLFNQTEKYNGGKQIMVWGAISNKGPLYLEQIEGTMNSEDYRKMLIRFFSTNQFSLDDHIFQQDNCRVHISKKVKNYLKNKKVDTLEWPPQSPDLNLIENVWSFLKDYLHRKKQYITTKEDVWKYSQQGFYSSECSELITQLYATYENRIQEQLRKQGGNTSY